MCTFENTMIPPCKFVIMSLRSIQFLDFNRLDKILAHGDRMRRCHWQNVTCYGTKRCLTYWVMNMKYTTVMFCRSIMYIQDKLRISCLVGKHKQIQTL